MSALMNKMATLPAAGAVTRPTRCVTVKAAGKGLRNAAILSSFLAAGPSMAAEAVAPKAQAVDVDSGVDSLINGIKATGELVKSGLTTAEAGFKVLKDGYDVAAPAIGKAYNAAAPVVGQAVRGASEAAAPVFRAVQPTIQDAGKALESTGITAESVNQATSLVQSTATSAATTATPFLIKFIQFLQSTDPLTLGEYGLGAVALTYLTPALLGLVGGSFRGFAGELAPAAALDMLVNEGNVVLIDIRSAKEKEGSGVPDLPSSASGKALEVEYAITEDKKLRGQLRDPSAIEAQVTALQVAALKKINKGTKLVLLDRYGPAARTVAKELGRKGYGKVFVIQGGFDGRAGWVSSKLQIKPAAIFSSSSSSAPSLATTVFTRSRKQLPAPRSS